ncbi:hypothetical protein V6Z96_002926 [Aspergillus fumigatus]|nr:hypothetical protein KXW69_001036 [Aspergillus fumigatus]KAH2068820.1 hypothetical protein KXW32_002625 [Aspergillus fumigatus]KAH2533398.1 hypothetical protein KXW12_002764 [Aspergillus fumigatus]KAH2574658.1 hypothetical protein KXV99_003782 [Aspergillus fumigatus]KAH3213173.1 hypothetical protein KXV86_003449 [Aspergillus fumigatus]
MFAPGQEQLSKEELRVNLPLIPFEPPLALPCALLETTSSYMLSHACMLTATPQAAEAQASQTVRAAITGGILLYLSPFAVDFVKKFL